jgi:tetratricopeptide (TPR) repeat protein
MATGQVESAARAAFERTRDEAFEALNEGHREAAGLILWTALNELDAVADDGVRRTQAGRVANLCSYTGFDDLALFAFDAAIELHEAAGDVRALANDRLTLGNVHLRLGNLATAESAWRFAHEAAKANGDYANAASAATNLGSLFAQEGDLTEAAALLEQSLAYLEREPFPETELNTRFVLMQVLDAQGAARARVLDVAAPLGSWGDQLTGPHRNRLTEVVEAALPEHPERRAQFSWLLEPA